MRQNIVAYISILTSVLFWGISFIWTNSLLLQGLPVFTIVFFRMFFAASILFTISVIFKRLKRVERRDWGWFSLLVLLEPFLYFIGETFGLKYVNSPTLGSIIIATIPIFALVAGNIVYREKISPINIVGIAITIPGILMVVAEKNSGEASHAIGIALLFLAVFAAVGYSVIVKRLATRYNSYTIVSYQHIFGSMLFLPLFLGNDLGEFSFSIMTPEILKPLLSLSIFCSAVAFVLFINSVKHFGVSKANIFTTLTPAVSAVVAYIIGQDTLTSSKVAGILIVITGVILAQRSPMISERAESSL